MNVISCFDAWSQWAIYTPTFISNLKCSFLGIDSDTFEVYFASKFFIFIAF